MDYKLSYEGWMIIVDSLPMEDISRLSRASSYLLQMLRPIIFSYVALFPTSTYSIHDMNDMLKRLHTNPVLAGWVEGFSVFLPPREKLAREMASNTLKSILVMNSIKYLSLAGTHLIYDKKEQHELCQFLSKCEGLVHLHLGPFTVLRNVDFPVSGIHSLDYRASDPCASIIS
jgi:hypothetical protein